MRAIVTGSAGFIGSHLVDRLRANGWDVFGIDRRTGPTIEQSRWGPIPPTCDAIFHLASPVGPLGVIREAGTIALQVIETTYIVANWAQRYHCPLIDVSTSEVYGSGGSDAETDPCVFQPATTARKEYAVAKLAAETMLRNTPLDVRIVRPFNVAGPRQRSDGGFVIPRFIEQALSGGALTVYAPGTQRRAFTHVLDVVDGLVLAYERGEPGEVYNLGNAANVTTMWELAVRVASAVGDGVPEIVDPVALHGAGFAEAPDKLPNADKARRLGWFPTRDLDQIIADAMPVPA